MTGATRSFFAIRSWCRPAHHRGLRPDHRFYDPRRWRSRRCRASTATGVIRRRRHRDQRLPLQLGRSGCASRPARQRQPFHDLQNAYDPRNGPPDRARPHLLLPGLAPARTTTRRPRSPIAAAHRTRLSRRPCSLRPTPATSRSARWSPTIGRACAGCIPRRRPPARPAPRPCTCPPPGTDAGQHAGGGSPDAFFSRPPHAPLPPTAQARRAPGVVAAARPAVDPPSEFLAGVPARGRGVGSTETAWDAKSLRARHARADSSPVPTSPLPGAVTRTRVIPVHELAVVVGLAEEEVGAEPESAWRSSSSSALALSAPIAALDPAALRRRMASSPPISGMRRSMSTRSGRQSAWIEMAAGPSRCRARLEARPREQLREDVPVDGHVVDDEHLGFGGAGRDLGDWLARGGRRRQADAPRREGERERAPDARVALHVEVSAHQARMPEADGEAETRAAGPLAGVELLEWLDNLLAVLGAAIPIPVSATTIFSTKVAPSALALAEALKRMLPRSVNLRALPARLMRICFTLAPFAQDRARELAEAAFDPGDARRGPADVRRRGRVQGH